MKKLNILLVSFICLFTVSCDDFLDVQPVGKVIPTTYDDFRALMTNAYETEGGLQSKSLASIRGDEFTINESQGDAKEHKDIYIWNDINQDLQVRVFDWQSYYKILVNVNHTINEGGEATDAKANDINQLLAEAYLLRAYTNFDLVNLYADIYNADNLNKLAIPLATEIDLEKDYKRNTIKEVYAQINSDINKGLELMVVEKQDKNINYRFSKVSALGFAARVYLFMSEWDLASNYAKDALVINSELVDLTLADAQSPVEYNSVENILAMERTFDNKVKSVTYISDKLVDAFDKTNDIRFSTFFEESKIIPDKYLGKIGGSDLKNKVSMRTAELYLILAEAQTKSVEGNLTEAKKYLKDLLITRLKTTYYAAEAAAIDAMSKEDFIKKVEEERMKELACQGFRWFDLRRNGKPELKKTFDGKEYTLKANDPRYVIPFPVEAVENNPNLKNN